MRVLLCHERFLFRYGADRVLMIIGKRLMEMGCRVEALGTHFDDATTGFFTHRVHRMEGPGKYGAFDDHAREWIDNNRKTSLGGPFDLIISGGWPFFSSIGLFREIAPTVLFVDCGVVPGEGLPSETRVILDQLRELRRRWLPDFTHIAANSEFVRRTQSEPDSGGRLETRAILNGCDHMEEFPDPTTEPASTQALRTVYRVINEGGFPVILLGRFEGRGYKNSPAAFRVLRHVRRVAPETRLLVLDQPSGIGIPPDLVEATVPLGFPSDRELESIMHLCGAGISVSLWEGFNLPIAEMYRIGRPALAFDLAAHPEVVPDPWFLCRDEHEMAGKLGAIACGLTNQHSLLSRDITAYQIRFSWNRFMDQLLDYVGGPLSSPGCSRLDRREIQPTPAT